MVHRAAMLSLLSVMPLAAQSLLTLPASHNQQEGTGSTNVPFGRSTPTRVQYAYDAVLFSGPVTITAVAFRLDGGVGEAAKLVDCEFRMSTLPAPLVAFASDFVSNRGADETVVLPRQILTLPASSATATPSPFLAPIPLPVPFAYDPANGGLVLEILVHGQPPGTYSLDVTYVCISPDLAVGPSACLGSSGAPVRVESATAQVIWGRPWTARVVDAPPSAIVILVLGTIDSGPWSGMVLPQDLGGLGASGCYLSIDIAGSWAGISGGDGSLLFPFTIPNNPGALGEWLRFQVAAFDATANPLGLITSQAKKVQVCGWEPVARLWSSGISAATGTREIGMAAVVRLTVQ